MLLAIISDTHDNLATLRKALSFCAEQNIGNLIHCGDVTSSETLLFIAKNFSGEIHVSEGNAELSKDEFKGVAKTEQNVHFHGTARKIIIDNVVIGFAHEPWLAKKLAEQGGYGVVFYGHTHKPWEETINNTTLINPGTLAGLYTKATFAVFDTATKKPTLILV